MSQTTTPSIFSGLDENGRRRLAQIAIMVAIYALSLFVPAGTLRWWNAWAYLVLYVLAILIGGYTVLRINPAIINERGRSSERTKSFDKLFGKLTIPLALGVYVVAGLDHRFNWTVMPLWLQVVGFIGILPAFFMPYWVMAVNAYAATSVRVEIDRGQHVITGGPYRYVRHPMYTAMIIGYVFDPLAFGSWWMAVPAALLIGLFIWRTAHEDQTLQEELPGYREYAGQTHYRLVPGVW